MEPSHIKIVKDICEGKDTCEIRPTSDMFGVRKQEGKVEEGENVGESREGEGGGGTDGGDGQLGEGGGLGWRG